MTAGLMGFLKEHYGFAGRVGGWIHRADGSPICQGYDELERQVTERGIILRRHPFIDLDKAQKFLGPPVDPGIDKWARQEYRPEVEKKVK